MSDSPAEVVAQICAQLPPGIRPDVVSIKFTSKHKEMTYSFTTLEAHHSAVPIAPIIVSRVCKALLGTVDPPSGG